jgi:hypothetical protein
MDDVAYSKFSSRTDDIVKNIKKNKQEKREPQVILSDYKGLSRIGINLYYCLASTQHFAIHLFFSIDGFWKCPTVWYFLIYYTLT